MQTKEVGEKQRHSNTVTIFRSKTKTLNSCRSLDYACGIKSIIGFNDLCVPNAMLGKSTHLQVIPQQRTQNTANLRLQTH